MIQSGRPGGRAAEGPIAGLAPNVTICKTGAAAPAVNM